MSSLDLTGGRAGAAPLWLLADGSFSTVPDAAPKGLAARDALVTAARWISGRRASTFAELFPPSAFHPEILRRPERLFADNTAGLFEQIRSALAAAAVGGEEALRDPIAAAQLRSAALTVLSHIIATARDDAAFRGPADEAAAEIFRLIDAEHGDTAQSALRGHAILLLQMRGPALRPADRARAVALLSTLARKAPPYADLQGPWRFAMCSDYEFHEGECEVLVRAHHFRKIDVPEGAPTIQSRWGSARPYLAFEAPFKTPAGAPIQILARSASPDDENREMGEPFFTGLLINRHAQLGSFDLRADAYDGFLDFYTKQIAEDLQASMTPRDPGVAASQIGGEAATGLGWAAGSMNRVTQYSDLWAGLPGKSELLYAFESAGFYSQREPPEDVPAGDTTDDPALLPAVCRYQKSDDAGRSFRVEVMMHAFLGHSGKELKRLLVAADALWRAIDLGYMPAEGDIETPLGQRAMLLLTLAGLLDFPADQNFIDGLWAMALKALRLPEISRSLVRSCITEQDHDADNYYGSRRGIGQLLDTQKKSDTLAYEKLASDDPSVGRAAPLDLTKV